MFGFLKRIVLVTLKDSIFCLAILFLCYNPYAGLSDAARISTIYVSFILYLLVPRIWRCRYDNPVFNVEDFQKVLEQREAFVAALAHDLKSPALSHISSLQMLLDETFGTLNKEQKGMIQAILNSCIFMKELVFTMLSTYKYDSGRVKLNLETFDAVELVNETVDEMKSIAMEEKVGITINSGLMRVNEIYADRVQLKRVVMNLISNAITNSFENTLVNINLVNDRGYFRFYIENSGHPLTDEMLRKLFRRFSSFSSKASHAGFGLGLYLSRKIIEAHEGYIKAESEDGRNIFSFYIPSVEPDKDAPLKKTGKIVF